MKITLVPVRRLAVAAALLGVVFSAPAASAQSTLDTSEAEAFLGTWDIPLQTDFGPLDVALKIEDQGGKVGASVGSLAQGGMFDVTDITRSGENLVLSYELVTEGGMLPLTLTLVPAGEGLTASFDVGGQFSFSGTATRTDG